MTVLELRDVTLEVAGRPLMKHVSAVLHGSERVGIVGPNGVGKTTLLRVLAGEREADAGSVVRAAGLRVGMLSQEPELPPESTVMALALAADGGERLRLESQLRRLESEMADDPSLVARYGSTLERYESLDGYAWEARVREHLLGVGLPRETWQLPAGALSGGQRVRLCLAGLLLAAPDVLLLDEPTNHLDIPAMRWLEGAMRAFSGTVLFVSHDRTLLRRMATHMWGFGPMGFATFPGPYEAFRLHQQRERERAEKERQEQDAERERLLAFIRKWKSGTRSRQAKDRERKLERLGESEALPTGRSMRLRFEVAAGRRREFLRVRDLSAAYATAALWRSLTLTLEEGGRLGIVGPNGSGKSTLLRILAGEKAAQHGLVQWADGVRIGWLRQDVQMEEGTLLETALRLPGMTRLQAHKMLGGALFEEHQMDTPVAELSGGERMRLSLALLSAQEANVLLLDEPTNHLDIDAQEALEEALSDFDGTVIAASHDRAFLQSVTNRWIIIGSNGTVHVTTAGPEWEEAVAVPEIQKPAKAAPPVKPVVPAKPPSAGLWQQLRQLEQAIAALEQRKLELESVFSGSSAVDWQEHGREYRAIEARLEEAYRQWEDLATELQGS